jgi:hypothetical protein
LPGWISRFGPRANFKMKMRKIYVALFEALLLVAGSVSV